MKTFTAMALFAALGLVAAGCAGGSKVLSGSTTKARTRSVSKRKTGTVVRSQVSPRLITVTGTVSISNVKTGTVVECRGEQMTETVPSPSEGVVSGGQWSITARGTSRPQYMRVTRLRSGVVTVSCTR